MGSLSAGLQFPRCENGVLDRVSDPVLEVGDDHHVLGESRGHGERLRERLDDEIPEVERSTDDDVTLVELPCDEAPPTPPLDQPRATALDDSVELASEPTDVRDRQTTALSDSSSDLR